MKEGSRDDSNHGHTDHRFICLVLIDTIAAIAAHIHDCSALPNGLIADHRPSLLRFRLITCILDRRIIIDGFVWILYIAIRHQHRKPLGIHFLMTFTNHLVTFINTSTT